MVSAKSPPKAVENKIPSLERPRELTSDQALGELAEAYQRLRDAVATLAKEEVDDLIAIESRTAPLFDRMHEIAWEVSAIEARTVRGIVAKASVLFDWCDGDRQQVSDALTLSLCCDITSVLGSDDPSAT